MSRKPKKQSAALPAAYYIPLILLGFLGVIGITAVVSRYPGLIRFELKIGVNSGVAEIDGRSPSAALPPGKQ